MRKLCFVLMLAVCATAGACSSQYSQAKAGLWNEVVNYCYPKYPCANTIMIANIEYTATMSTTGSPPTLLYLEADYCSS